MTFQIIPLISKGFIVILCSQKNDSIVDIFPLFIAVFHWIFYSIRCVTIYFFFKNYQRWLMSRQTWPVQVRSGDIPLLHNSSFPHIASCESSILLIISVVILTTWIKFMFLFYQIILNTISTKQIVYKTQIWRHLIRCLTLYSIFARLCLFYWLIHLIQHIVI